MLSKIVNAVLVIILLAGISLLAYPSFSDYWHRIHQSEAVAVYEDQVQKIDHSEAEAALQKAEEYNQQLFEAADKNGFIESHRDDYQKALNLDGSGVMGYIEIPTIACTLPIYHGTEESVLQVAVGHLEWTSLPIGGENTHSVLSGHRGLPSAKLFTDLDLVKEGDTFTVHILDQTYYYQVDQISVVLPEEANSLLPEAGKDYCTLITCTPYGVNSHRLLVRGSRIFPSIATVEVESDVNAVPRIAVSAACSALIFLLAGLSYRLRKRFRRRNSAKNKGGRHESTDDEKMDGRNYVHDDAHDRSPAADRMGGHDRP